MEPVISRWLHSQPSLQGWLTCSHWHTPACRLRLGRTGGESQPLSLFQKVSDVFLQGSGSQKTQSLLRS